MEKFYAVAQIRAAEEAEITCYPKNALMQKAAYAVAYHAMKLLREQVKHVYGCTVLLLVGGGGNGGDALYAGVQLRRNGVCVHAIEFSPNSTHSDAKTAFLQAGGIFISTLTNHSYSLAIDGISGIGARGPLRENAAHIVAQLDCPILAIDIPTGVDPDTGYYENSAVNAAVTVTFGARKLAHILAQERCGTIHVVKFSAEYYRNLGNPAAISYGDDDGYLWPVPGPHDDKYSTGVVGIISGSHEYLGAALLSSGGATAATSGMVRYVGVVRDDIVKAWPDVVATDTLAAAGQVQAWVVGPGSGPAVGDILSELLEKHSEPLVIDADAITALAHSPGLLEKFTSTRSVILTPHAGEFARLCGMEKSAVLRGNAIELVSAKAQETKATILLKGKNTIIAHPDGRIVIQRAPSSWAATPGSGDVLAGIIGALFAATLNPLLATGLGAWAHAQAAYFAAQYCANPDPNIQHIRHIQHTPGAPIRSQQIISALSLVIRDAREYHLKHL